MVFRFSKQPPRTRGVDSSGAPRREIFLSPQLAFYQRLNPRLFVLSGILGAFFLILLGGLAWQQLWKHSDYESLERRETLRRILQPGPRGRILDRNGVPLVENRPRYSVVLYVDEMRKEFTDEFSRLRKDWLARTHDDTSEAHPTLDRNKLYHEACVNVAQHYLTQATALLGRQATLDEEAFVQHVEQKPLLPFTLISDLTTTEFARLNEEIPVTSPMQTRLDVQRYYPFGSLAFHTLGWVGLTDDYDEENWFMDDLAKHSTFTFRGMSGRDGLEKLHDDTLNGKPGGEVWVVDPANSRFERVEKKIPEPGEDFQCSLDVNLQQVAEKSIVEVRGIYSGSAVALDVRTGEVLVLASKPNFDLNETVPKFSAQLLTDLATVKGAWVNRAIQGVYPPGSTFKLVTTIAGLRTGILDRNTLIDCPGFITIGDATLHDDSDSDYPEGHGKLNVVDALAISNDVFYYKLGLQMGWKPINQEAKDLGLGQQTGIGLHEAPTQELIVPDPEIKRRIHGQTWTRFDDATFAFGQNDLQVTPLQMACLLASIARNEKRTQPTLVHNPNLPANAVTQHSEPLGLTPDQRQLLLEGMEKVVSADGTGRLAQVPGIRVAGKTGTGQWGSHKDTTVAWFVCFAPVENPRIAIAVAVESPQVGSDIYGGGIAGPVAQKILEEYFKLHPINSTQQKN